MLRRQRQAQRQPQNDDNNNLRGSLSKHKKRSPNVTGILWLVIFTTCCCLVWLLGRFNDKHASTSTITVTVKQVKEEFYMRYGGKQEGDRILAKGVQIFGTTSATAERILQSAALQEPFVMSFAGYSVTVGRGNYFTESYPFVIERILQPLVQSAFGISVRIRNSAIGGIPSFPYGFCFEHFLGEDASVISWDYSMNEGNGNAVLESYLRHSQAQLKKQPMMILLDTNKQRCSLLKEYTEKGLIKDALCVGMANSVLDVKAIAEKPDSEKPLGLRQWNDFGAPNSCPGRGSWHPKKAEHELIGWMMAMYFVTAVEEALEIASKNPNWKTHYATKGSSLSTPPYFPKPLASHLPENDQVVTNLLYGHDTDNNSHYVLNHVSCRTNFLPAMDESKVLPSVIVSGLNRDVTAQDILKERSDEEYKKGWVLDVSKVERDTKIKVNECGGLGYVDMKIALYGIPESGTLRLWLPAKTSEMDATKALNELVFCEANEKRPPLACHLDTDLTFTVGGVAASHTKMILGAGEYLKRQTCLHVGVPSGAKMTALKDVRDGDNKPISVAEQERLGNGSTDGVGLVVDIKVTGQKVSRKDGACCLSHIIWEHGR